MKDNYDFSESAPNPYLAEALQPASLTRRIERLILGPSHQPLLLCCQPQFGKTDLYREIVDKLPQRIVPMLVVLPELKVSTAAEFLLELSQSISQSAAQRNISTPNFLMGDDPFTAFDEFLDDLEISLGESTAWLILDGFKALRDAFDAGQLSESMVLGMLRNVMQHRPKFQGTIAGSLSLSEFERWSSYLLNAQVFQLSLNP
jgi:hypothetical protein